MKLKNTDIFEAVIITHDHPDVNFGQTGKFISSGTSKLGSFFAHGEDNISVPTFFDECYPVANTHDYSAYNKAISKVGGWPHQHVGV